LRSFPHFRRRHAVGAAEGAVEVGDVTEPGIIGDRADAPTIAASMADPALDATMVAARLGITVRYVHHLLEPTGRSFSEHLLDKRLARVVELLREAGQRHRKIADIAFKVGFKDLSYFNRMFRRK
jgi:AraC-like DNA-binding protein